MIAASPLLNEQDFTDLPGAEFLGEGLGHLREGRESVPALLVEIAAPRLRFAGVDVPEIAPNLIEAETRLYRLLGRMHQGEDAYSQYNAWLRRLISLCQALEMRRSRRMRQRQAECKVSGVAGPGRDHH